jgi:hypothetical protein
MRKPALIIGVLLLVAGGLISAGMLSIPDKKEILSVGDASLSVTQQKKPDRTLGYVLLALGAVGVIVGVAGKKR